MRMTAAKGFVIAFRPTVWWAVVRSAVVRSAAVWAAVVWSAGGVAIARAESPTIRTIEQRGVVRCAMMRAPGFAATDAGGRPVGFMVDMCRALAAAVLGDADAIEIRRPAKVGEFAAVAAGEVDVSFAQTTWTFTRDVAHPVDFGPPIYHDVLSLAAWRDADGASPFDGKPAVACSAAGSTASSTLERHVGRHRMPWTTRELPSWTDVFQAFVSRECAVAAVDRSVMLTSLSELGLSELGLSELGLTEPGLTEPGVSGDRPIIRDLPWAPQPIAPVAANRDRDWLTVIRWTMFALILAEEKGITRDDASRRREGSDGEVRRLLNGVPEAAARLGLRPDWGFQVISQLGNYGEIFDRHLGSASPYRLQRGLNRSWSDGGALHSPPMQ